MGYSKRQFVTAALEELGLAAFVFDLSPEQLQSALRRLDSLLAEWNGKGIMLGFPIAANPDDADLDTPTDAPDWATDAVVCNLAVRIGPSYGRQPMAETKASAISGYNMLMARFSKPPQMQLPGTIPAGAGNKPWNVTNDPFIIPPQDSLDVGNGQTIDFN